MNKSLYILGQLNDVDSDWLSSIGQVLHCKPGTMLIRQGVYMDRLYIILDGELKVLISSGKEIARVGAGDILGEMSFVDESPTSASVEVITDTRVLSIDRQSIKERMECDTSFAARFYKAIAIFLADRMRNTISRFGYGNVTEDARIDELDETVLDNVYLAGSRFERMVKKLLG